MLARSLRQVTNFMTYSQRFASTVKVGDTIPNAKVGVVRYGPDGWKSE